MGAKPNWDGGPVVPIEDLLACVDRELKMRAQVYPRWVNSPRPKLTQQAADTEIARMRAVRDKLVRGEAQLRVLAKLFNASPAMSHQICEDIEEQVRAILSEHPPA